MSVQCDGTPALCYDTSVMLADTSLFSASSLLLVLRHFCYVGRHVSNQCYDTHASATTLLLRGQARIALAPLFNTIQYLRVPIMLRLSHSLLLVYTGKHLYDKNMNHKR